MMEKYCVGALFLVFVFVRTRWPRGKDERVQVKPLREWLTSTVFTLSLLLSYVAYLWTGSIDMYNFESPIWFKGFGGLLSLLGVILLEWVHQALGHHFSPHLELREDHRIVREGPYAFVRHPMYSSGLCFLIGNGILSSNGIVLFVPTCSFILLLVLRVRDEETMLRLRFGLEWERYTQKTGFILPRFYRKPK